MLFNFPIHFHSACRTQSEPTLIYVHFKLDYGILEVTMVVLWGDFVCAIYMYVCVYNIDSLHVDSLVMAA